MNTPDLSDLVSDDDQLLIRAIVTTLGVLRKMDAERISFILTQTKLAKAIFPKEIQEGFEVMEADFTLILAFIEQAKKYDNSAVALESLDWILGKEKDEGTKTS